MHILHIANSYCGTQVYMNLVNAIDNLNVRQTVIVPLKECAKLQCNTNLPTFNVSQSRIIFLPYLKKKHKFLYDDKINTILKLINENVDFSTVDIIQAGTCFFDGAVAYEINKLYKIPYVTAVRSTDKLYRETFFWKKKYFKNVLLHAGNIVFINSNLKKYIVKSFCLHGTDLLKCTVIENGISNYFLDNIATRSNGLHTPIRLIYTSAFLKRKCLKEVIKASAILVNKGYKLTLDAYGMGLPNKGEEIDYIDIIKKYTKKYNWFFVHNYVTLEKNLELMRESDILVLPSKGETFGLVYPEALSQGIPVLYGSNEGFDGLFDDGYVGFAARPYDILDISQKIEAIILNYKSITSNIANLDIKNRFSWSRIAECYIELYKNNLLKK